MVPRRARCVLFPDDRHAADCLVTSCSVEKKARINPQSAKPARGNLPSRLRQRDLAHMATIESYVQPRRLYRYRSIANLDRELDSILKGYLYCSPYMKLNDPMEGLFTSSSPW